MTQQQINENNKAIALFMGATKCPRCEDQDCLRFGSISYSAKDMKYADSWDWLMPVVEKINSKKDATINIDSTIAFLHIGKKCIDFEISEYGSWIMALYAAVVHFLTLQK